MPAETAVPRLKLVASGLFFVAYLAIEISVPLYVLVSHQDLAVGWTMYTGLRETPEFTAVYNSGATEPLKKIQQERKIGIVLGDKVDQPRFVPPYLCQALPDIQAVVIHHPYSGKDDSYSCR